MTDETQTPAQAPTAPVAAPVAQAPVEEAKSVFNTVVDFVAAHPKTSLAIAVGVIIVCAVIF